jgi:hypothetical protein
MEMALGLLPFTTSRFSLNVRATLVGSVETVDPFFGFEVTIYECALLVGVFTVIKRRTNGVIFFAIFIS